jgi:hypothetical protein
MVSGTKAVIETQNKSAYIFVHLGFVFLRSFAAFQT